MGYIDSHGRPELVAQPFIKKGTTKARLVYTADADDQVTIATPIAPSADQEQTPPV